MKNTSNLARYMMMNNRYQPTERHTMESGAAENRFRDRREREHYDNGRYAPTRSEYRSPDSYANDNMEDGWDVSENRIDNEDDSKEHRPNIIGFSSVTHKNAASPLNKEIADEWMHNVVNEDGTKGAHWTLEEIKRLMQQKGVECDPVKLWVAMNAEYSDRQKVNKKYGVDRTDFYLDSAIAFWLKDADAVKDKLSSYYTYVVKH